MDYQVELDLGGCLCCNNDIEALDYYLALGNSKDLEEYGVEFVNSNQDKIIDIVENIIPAHFKPLPVDWSGYLFADEEDSIEDINTCCTGRHKIKMISSYDESEAEEGWKFLHVTIPKGSMCYIFQEIDSGIEYAFTKADIKLKQ